MSLTEIRERLNKMDWSHSPDELINRHNEYMETAATSSVNRKINDVKREQIVEKATELFSRIGYEAVRVSDITDALRMSKATFYEYFQGKEQLFIGCIERLVVEIVPREGWQSIKQEENYFKRQKIRARQFLNSFPGYSGILQQARIFSRVENQEMAAKAKETFNIMTRPLKRDIEKACSKGAIRPFDPEIGAHMLLGLIEGLGWKMMVDPSMDVEQLTDAVIDMLMHGLLPRGEIDGESPRNSGLYAQIIDIRGAETIVECPMFADLDYLEARTGEALVKLNLQNTRSLTVEQVEADCIKLSVFSCLDHVLPVTIFVGIRLTGQTPFGEFCIPMEKVKLVRFGVQPPSTAD